MTNSKDKALCTAIDALYSLILIVNLFIYCASALGAPANYNETTGTPPTPQINTSTSSTTAQITNSATPNNSQTQINSPAQTKVTSQANPTETKPEIRKYDSRDGAFTAYVKHVQPTDVTRVTILDKRTGKPVTDVGFPGEISEVQWLAESSTALYLARAHANSPVHLYSIDAEKNLLRDLTPFASKNVSSFAIATNCSSVIAYIDMDKKDEFKPLLVDTISGATTLLPDQKYDHVVKRMKNLVTTEGMPAKQRQQVATATMSGHYGHYSPTFNWGKMCTAVPVGAVPTRQIALKDQEKYRKLIEGSADQRILFFANHQNDPKLKKFSDEEKRQVLRAWRWICTNAPTLALRATHGNRIIFYRKSENHAFNAVRGKMDIAASAGVNSITLYDGLFKESESEQLSALVHEVTHEVDILGHLSLSRRWLDLVQPEISTTRGALNFGKVHGILTLDDYGAQYFGLPSLYSAAEPQESLAEWTVAILFGKVKAPSEVQRFIEEKVFGLDCAEEVADRQFVDAYIKLERGDASDHSDAMHKLEILTAKYPDFLAPPQELVNQYINHKQFQRALPISNELLHRFEVLKIDNLSSHSHAYVLYQHGNILSALHDYAGAWCSLNRALAKAPQDEEFLSAQKWMNKYHKSAKPMKKKSLPDF
ncbi:MAG TPA: hypothetical protein V6C89_20800 [Drouetiella sp.]|jgi:tetratricopeptide (TPR) repeat protein